MKLYHSKFRSRDDQKQKRRAYYKRTYVPADQAAKTKAALERAPFRARARQIRQGIVQRSLERGFIFDRATFTINDIEQMLRAQRACECCGVAFRIQQRVGGKWCDASPTFDRLDSSRGYTAENVALICWRCNRIKSDATVDELERLATWYRKRTDLQRPVGGESADIPYGLLSLMEQPSV